MLEFLGQILQYVWEMLPRPELVKSTEVGVSFLFGKHPRIIRPRPTIVWELFEEWAVYPSIEQTSKTKPFEAEDYSHRTYRLTVSVDWTIKDPLIYHRAQQDGEERIITAVQSIAGKVIRDGKINDDDLTDALEKEMASRGIAINMARIISIGKFRLFRLDENINENIDEGDDSEELW